MFTFLLQAQWIALLSSACAAFLGLMFLFFLFVFSATKSAKK